MFMRTAMRASSMFTAEDFKLQSKGKCPECKLPLPKQYRASKRSETRRNIQYILRLVAVPVLMLPVVIIVIAFIRLTTRAEYPITRMESAVMVFDPDIEREDKELLQGVKTSFILPSPFRLLRQKREKPEEMDVYQGNTTRESIVWVVNTSQRKMNYSNPFAFNLSNISITSKSKRRMQVEPQNATAEHVHASSTGEESVSVDGDYGEQYPDGNRDYWYEEITEEEEDKLNSIKTETEGEEEGAEVELDISSNANGVDDFRLFWRKNEDPEKIRKAQAQRMLQYMDRSTHPCNDFYQYACGNWGKTNPIPRDKAGYDTFEMLRENLDTALSELLTEPISSGDTKSSAIVKAKHLYHSCMNYEILEHRRDRPLLDLLDRLGGWPVLCPSWDSTRFDWLSLMAKLRLYNNDILISQWIAPDIKNSDEYVIQLDQTSLGLPTRDYFLQPSNHVYLEAYRKYLITVANLLGAPLENATDEAEGIINFETELAKLTLSSDDRRNISEIYQRMTLGELKQLIPQIGWKKYLCKVLRRPVDYKQPVVVFALRYFQDLVVLLKTTPPRTISNYLLWRFIRHRVNNLDDRFQEAKQTFYFVLFGREEAPPRWKNCVTQVNSNMGMAVGALFVKKYFDENSKNDTLRMTREIQQSFRDILNRTEWIDEETKELATDKVDAMTLRIGYPDFILIQSNLDERYKDVQINPDKYFENTLNILRHLTQVEQERLDKPVNKSIWSTAPAVVNAYYSRNKNQIMFPAGILQPPFYHHHFPRSLNYGGIGVVIGHEVTHGFDDKGRLFDRNGNLHRWWHEDAIHNFHERAQCLVDQYSHYMVKEVSMRIDGVNTQGENIADNGGIKQAYKAYQEWLEENNSTDETLPGLNATNNQLFFLNFAQVWCGLMRPEATRNKLKTAVHSPGKFRVIGTLSNSLDFVNVYSCPPGSPMNPVKKCEVW